jgi:hypothetical protein
MNVVDPHLHLQGNTEGTTSLLPKAKVRLLRTTHHQVPLQVTIRNLDTHRRPSRRPSNPPTRRPAVPMDSNSRTDMHHSRDLEHHSRGLDIRLMANRHAISGT